MKYFFVIAILIVVLSIFTIFITDSGTNERTLSYISLAIGLIVAGISAYLIRRQKA